MVISDGELTFHGYTNLCHVHDDAGYCERIGSSFSISPLPLSKRKISLEDDGAVPRCWRSELPTGERLTFAKQRRIQHSVGSPKIDDVEEVGCPSNKGKVVPPWGSRIEMELCRTAA